MAACTCVLPLYYAGSGFPHLYFSCLLFCPATTLPHCCLPTGGKATCATPTTCRINMRCGWFSPIFASSAQAFHAAHSPSLRLWRVFSWYTQGVRRSTSASGDSATCLLAKLRFAACAALPLCCGHCAGRQRWRMDLPLPRARRWARHGVAAACRTHIWACGAVSSWRRRGRAIHAVLAVLLRLPLCQTAARAPSAALLTALPWRLFILRHGLLTRRRRGADGGVCDHCRRH